MIIKCKRCGVEEKYFSKVEAKINGWIPYKKKWTCPKCKKMINCSLFLPPRIVDIINTYFTELYSSKSQYIRKVVIDAVFKDLEKFEILDAIEDADQESIETPSHV